MGEFYIWISDETSRQPPERFPRFISLGATHAQSNLNELPEVSFSRDPTTLWLCQAESISPDRAGSDCFDTNRLFASIRCASQSQPAICALAQPLLYRQPT